MRAVVPLLAAVALTLAACGDTTDPADVTASCLEGSTEQECEDVGTGAPDDPDETDDTEEPDDTSDAVRGDEPMTSDMCAADQPDCIDTVEPDDSDAADGTCLAGAEDCADDPSNGEDVARPVPLTDTAPDAAVLPEGESDAASGSTITSAHLQDDGRTLSLTINGGACDVLQDVVLQESDAEVRLLVLSGMDREVEACTQQIVTWRVDVELSSPLGQRTVADLAG